MQDSLPGLNNAPASRPDPDLAALVGACARWSEAGNPAPLARWVATELDHQGMPRRIAVADWAAHLARLERARIARPGWPEPIRDRIDGWLGWSVHLSRPDGSAIFGARGRDGARSRSLRRAAADHPNPAYTTVLDRWFAAEDAAASAVPPPLPAISSPDRVFAVLRPDWTTAGDWLALDHRARADATLVELAGEGRPWLLGDWRTDGPVGAVGPSRLVSWKTGPTADLLEWTFRLGATRITRTAVLLRYRQVALLAQQEDGPASPGFRLPLATGTTVLPGVAAGTGGLVLGRARGSARLIPLGRPSPADPIVEGSEVVVPQAPEGKRRWLPIALTWGKAPIGCQALTVTEKSEICRADVAIGVRLSWGVGHEGLLIYRSLAPPSLRAVLGLQTRARFLVARFLPDGKVTPLVSLD